MNWQQKSRTLDHCLTLLRRSSQNPLNSCKMKKRPAGCVKTQSTRAQFTYEFSKSVETGWFTEHLLNGIGFQIAAALRRCEYYTMPKNENQALFPIYFDYFRTLRVRGARIREPRKTRSRSTLSLLRGAHGRVFEKKKRTSLPLLPRGAHGKRHMRCITSLSLNLLLPRGANSKSFETLLKLVATIGIVDRFAGGFLAKALENSLALDIFLPRGANSRTTS